MRILDWMSRYRRTGTYYVHLDDTQQKGGAAYGYRLRISAPRPDFELRIVPSSINVAAGATLPLTVYALRRDGFSGEITLGIEGHVAGIHIERRQGAGGSGARAVDADRPADATGGAIPDRA